MENLSSASSPSASPTLSTVNNNAKTGALASGQTVIQIPTKGTDTPLKLTTGPEPKRAAPTTSGGAYVPKTNNGCCSCRSVFHFILVAFAVAGLVAGAIALLVYLGTLQIILTKVGALSRTVALYAAVVGGTVAFLSVVGLFISMCFKNANDVISKPKFRNQSPPPAIPTTSSAKAGSAAQPQTA